MPIAYQEFRHTLIQAVKAQCGLRPAAYLYLVYTPELHDPLNLASDSRRATAFVLAPEYVKAVTPQKPNAPRLITLDCRRVASYLLETDPRLDDPAFEESITQAYDEVVLAKSYDREVGNDERDFAACVIGGWLIGPEDAQATASRLANFSRHRQAWVRWTSPSVLGALWPTLTSEQRFNLLGDATWLAFDAGGTLTHFAGKVESKLTTAGAQTHASFDAPLLDQQQMRIIKNVPLVADLLASWKTMEEEEGGELPLNAEQRLHVLVVRAQQAGLDADSVSLYTMTAVQLQPGAIDDPEWTALVSHSARNAITLRDRLDALTSAFWDRYAFLP